MNNNLDRRLIAFVEDSRKRGWCGTTILKPTGNHEWPLNAACERTPARYSVVETTGDWAGHDWLDENGCHPILTTRQAAHQFGKRNLRGLDVKFRIRSGT